MKETAWGLYVGGVTNLAVAALLNNSAWEPDTSDWLVTFGVWNELLGVLMVASPELLPRAEKVGRFLIAQARSVRAALTRLLYRLFAPSPQTIYGAGGISGAGRIGGVAEVVQGPPPNPTTAEMFDYVMAQVENVRIRVGETERELARLPERRRADIDEARRELEGLSRELVRRVADARIRLRLIGLGYVVIGLVLAWAGNIG